MSDTTDRSDAMFGDARLPKRFWDKVRVNVDTGCWEWIGAHVSRGYGNVVFHGKMVQAHRLAFEMLAGEIPDGTEIDHLCRNHACIRPSHLEPVTHRENVLRGSGPCSVNAKKTRCPMGHPLFGENLRIERSGRRRCVECKRRQTRNAMRKIYDRRRAEQHHVS